MRYFTANKQLLNTQINVHLFQNYVSNTYCYHAYQWRPLLFVFFSLIGGVTPSSDIPVMSTGNDLLQPLTAGMGGLSLEDPSTSAVTVSYIVIIHSS